MGAPGAGRGGGPSEGDGGPNREELETPSTKYIREGSISANEGTLSIHLRLLLPVPGQDAARPGDLFPSGGD